MVGASCVFVFCCIFYYLGSSVACFLFVRCVLRPPGKGAPRMSETAVRRLEHQAREAPTVKAGTSQNPPKMAPGAQEAFSRGIWAIWGRPCASPVFWGEAPGRSRGRSGRKLESNPFLILCRACLVRRRRWCPLVFLFVGTNFSPNMVCNYVAVASASLLTPPAF